MDVTAPDAYGQSGGERNSARSTQRLPEPREDHEVGVQADALDPTDTEERESVLVLQPAELALNRRATMRSLRIAQ